MPVVCPGLAGRPRVSAWPRDGSPSSPRAAAASASGRSRQRRWGGLWRSGQPTAASVHGRTSADSHSAPARVPPQRAARRAARR
ncbi:MAG: hypothetical protein F4184_09910 [Gemmatimonadetes bacterium]|nr:hypothetical protein [Gemmatimonadota bacterium]